MAAAAASTQMDTIQNAQRIIVGGKEVSDIIKGERVEVIGVGLEVAVVFVH